MVLIFQVNELRKKQLTVLLCQNSLLHVTKRNIKINIKRKVNSFSIYLWIPPKNRSWWFSRATAHVCQNLSIDFWNKKILCQWGSPDKKWTRKENEIFAHKLKICLMKGTSGKSKYIVHYQGVTWCFLLYKCKRKAWWASS